ncbi:DUF2975 domain-containing protein [Nocardioides sp. HDW12B]|uniref:DUF2975 domain-containing protein n=1 Tax=Nocardioides sp. HDW12B TaxID=2714939 RepID=UPI001F1049CA|nr:DUF2975 domain-containing protein [Nocardioides sp. HDW12B]
MVGSSRGMRAASVAVLVGWVGALLAAVVTAGVGVAGLAGWSDSFVQRVDLSGGLGLVELDVAPTWEAGGVREICAEVDLRDYPTECLGFILDDGSGDSQVGGVVRQGDVVPQSIELRGPLVLDAEPGWNALLASLFAMQVLALLVVTVTLFQLWRLLRTAARGEPFTGEAVRRLRTMGALLLGWELVEPVLWLFLSPKAWDYNEGGFGPTGWLQLGSMEPGGPSLTVMAFGALLLLLAQVFRRGADLADEQRLTV